MKSGNWKSVFCKGITVLAQIGTLATAFVALFALRESISQRESMYKPEVLIETSYIQANFLKDGKAWFYKVDKDSLKIEEDIVFPYYNLVNVGFGAALKANVYWHLDPSLIEDYFKINIIKDVQCIKQDSINIYRLGDEKFEIANDGVVSSWPVDYVMPLSTSDKYARGYLHPRIGYALSMIMKWKCERSGSYNDYDSVLRVPVTLKYCDINSKWYTKKFWMNIFALKYQSNGGIVYGIYPQKDGKELSRDYEEMGDV